MSSAIATMTIICTDNNGEVEQMVTEIHSKEKTTIGKKDIPKQFQSMEKVSDVHFDYTFSRKKKQVEIKPKDKSFGVYSFANESKTTVVGNRSFILANTKFTIIDFNSNPNNAVLQYSNITEEKEPAYTSLKKDKVYIIGRSPTTQENEEIVEVDTDPKISRSHCKLFFNKETLEWNIEDLNSHNGIYVKLKRSRQTIKWDQFVRIGVSTYVYFSIDE